MLQGPRAVWEDPTQQEGCSVCLQRLREQKSILRQPLVFFFVLPHFLFCPMLTDDWQHQKPLRRGRWQTPTPSEGLEGKQQQSLSTFQCILFEH